MANDCNKLFMILLSNTESTLKDIIKQEIKNPHYLFVNKITFNRVNKFITNKILIEFSNLIKAFESFKIR